MNGTSMGQRTIEILFTHLLGLLVLAALVDCKVSDDHIDLQEVSDLLENQEDSLFLIEMLELRIELTSQRSEVVWGEPVAIRVNLCNKTKKNVDIVPLLLPQAHFLKIEVKDEKGNILPYIGPEFRLKIPEPTSLGPNDCLSRHFDLYALFKLPTSGVFTVKADYFDRSSGALLPQQIVNIVSSNVLRFAMVRPTWESDR